MKVIDLPRPDQITFVYVQNIVTPSAFTKHDIMLGDEVISLVHRAPLSHLYCHISPAPEFSSYSEKHLS